MFFPARTLCACDSACKYLVRLAKLCKEQKPLCNAGGKTNVGARARDVLQKEKKKKRLEKVKKQETKRFVLGEGAEQPRHCSAPCG